MPPVSEERLEPVRAYLRQAFPDWELADQWDGDLEAHSFRLYRHREPVHLLKVSRNVLDDNRPEELSAMLGNRNTAQALRQAQAHRLILTSNGLAPI